MPHRIFFVIVLCLFFFNAAPSGAQEETNNSTRAKIGILIKSGECISGAKSHTRLKSGDSFRVYVQPEDRCVIYIIRTDEKRARLVNMTEQTMHSSMLVLPSPREYFHVEGNSDAEQITIICSPLKLPELSPLEANDISFPRWASIQDTLIQKSQMILPAENEEPISIGGTVRGLDTSSNGSAFVKKLRIYSGKGLLVKNYEFKVKK